MQNKQGKAKLQWPANILKSLLILKIFQIIRRLYCKLWVPSSLIPKTNRKPKFTQHMPNKKSKHSFQKQIFGGKSFNTKLIIAYIKNRNQALTQMKSLKNILTLKMKAKFYYNYKWNRALFSVPKRLLVEGTLVSSN